MEEKMRKTIADLDRRDKQLAANEQEVSETTDVFSDGPIFGCKRTNSLIIQDESEAQIASFLHTQTWHQTVCCLYISDPPAEWCLRVH